jgi:hypothetical protein
LERLVGKAAAVSPLHLSDPGLVEVVLAAGVANACLDDDPLWMLVVGPPSLGKAKSSAPCATYPGRAWPPI